MSLTEGLTLVFTGEAPVAAGMVLRALGQGFSVLVWAIDGDGAVYRELARIDRRLTVFSGDPGRCPAVMAGEKWDMVVFEAGDGGGSAGRQLAGFLAARSPGTHVVVTGRGDPDVPAADLVTRFERRK